MKKILSFLALLLTPVSAGAVSISDYGFDCDPGTFVGCGWVGAGADAVLQMAMAVNFRILGVIWGVGIVAVAYGAIRIISSRGQSEGIEQGKKAIQWAVVGIILMTLAIPFINFVIDFFYNIA